MAIIIYKYGIFFMIKKKYFSLLEEFSSWQLGLFSKNKYNPKYITITMNIEIVKHSTLIFTFGLYLIKYWRFIISEALSYNSSLFLKYFLTLIKNVYLITLNIKKLIAKYNQ